MSGVDAVILIAHGSRNTLSNQEVVELANTLQSQSETSERRSQSQPLKIVPAFLEITSPTLHEAVDALVAEGHKRIQVLPYFLNSGNHVTKDIPALVNEACTKHEGVSIKLTPHFGQHPQIPALLLSMLAGEG